MRTTLKHIANIQTGIYAHPVTSGKIVYLQVKHFSENGQLNDIIKPDLPLNNQTEKHLLNDGDVLFAAKGTNNFAVQYENKNGNCVASSTFLVIRFKEEFRKIVFPKYLCWYINHSKTQEWIKAKARGSSIPSVSKMDLQELELIIPPIEKQKAIVKIDSLQKKEQSIMRKIQLLKEQYIQNRLITAINK